MIDELAARRRVRTKRRVVAHRSPPPDDDEAGDTSVIALDLGTMRGMAVEVVSEALAVGDDGLIDVIARMALAVDVAHKAALAVEGRET